MGILRFIFAVIFTPVRLLANLLTQSKDSVLEWYLNYGPSFVKIQTKYKGEVLSDDLLIASYILFLARYFYICDSRQIDIVRNYLLDQVGKSQKPSEFTPRLYEAVFQTLNNMEKDATHGLFRIYNRLLPMPPMAFSEGEEPAHSFAKYKFFVFKHAGDKELGHIFHMSAGPDIILLPITVGILYEYVLHKLQDKAKKDALDRSIIALLKEHSVIDCRSMTGQFRLPNEIIKKNHLNY